MTLRPRQPLDASSIRGTSEEEVLRTFVASVRQWRDSSVTNPAFRQDDLIVLAGIFGTDPAEIERRLIALTGCDRKTARRLRRLLLASIALPVAFTALTSAPRELAAGAPASEQVEEAEATPDVVVISRSAAPPAVAVAVPEVDTTVVSVPASAPADTEVATEVAPGSEATVSIDRLGLERAVVGGGQDVIDQGHVAHYWAPGWHEPAGAGAVGTYWLAAHHETHGSPFLLLPDVVVGDLIEVATVGQTFTYTVTSMEVVEDDAGFGPVYGTDPTASVILLQTCLDDVRRLLVHGTLTAVD